MKIVYWITTVILFLWEGVMPAIFGNSEMAKLGTMHLGYPDYFRVTLNIFKIVGALALILPMVKGRFKEWPYVGFGIVFICAAVSHGATDGIDFQTFMPLIFLGILAVSYITYHKTYGKTA